MDVGYKIRDRYIIQKKIGEGSFGDVYKGYDLENDDFIAIKVEKIEKTNSNKSRLDMERDIYANVSGKGVPEIVWNGVINDRKILIMTYLGPSLEDLFIFCNRKFTYKTICLIAIQIIDRLELIHERGVIHRDIKPDNFLIGLGQNRANVFIVDFGLSKSFISNNKHIEYKNNKNFTGTYRYASIRNHNGIEQSRRDDLESLGYMLVYFAKGRLPWQGVKKSNKEERNKIIYKIKRNTSIEDLCDGLPEEFYVFLKHCRLLRFTEIPDYDYLKSIFVNLMGKFGYKYDGIFDWNIRAQKKKKKMENSS